jgi:APA family basic amino acid/polyamine antiporter
MATTARPGPFATKPADQLLETAEATRLNRTKPDKERGFRVPWVPVVPLAGAALCVYLMTKLPAETWARFGIWLALGAVIYVVFGYRNSRLRRAA